MLALLISTTLALIGMQANLQSSYWSTRPISDMKKDVFYCDSFCNIIQFIHRCMVVHADNCDVVCTDSLLTLKMSHLKISTDHILNVPARDTTALCKVRVLFSDSLHKHVVESNLSATLNPDMAHKNKVEGMLDDKNTTTSLSSNRFGWNRTVYDNGQDMTTPKTKQTASITDQPTDGPCHCFETLSKYGITHEKHSGPLTYYFYNHGKLRISIYAKKKKRFIQLPFVAKAKRGARMYLDILHCAVYIYDIDNIHRRCQDKSQPQLYTIHNPFDAVLTVLFDVDRNKAVIEVRTANGNAALQTLNLDESSKYGRVTRDSPVPFVRVVLDRPTGTVFFTLSSLNTLTLYKGSYVHVNPNSIVQVTTGWPQHTLFAVSFTKDTYVLCRKGESDFAMFMKSELILVKQVMKRGKFYCRDIMSCSSDIFIIGRDKVVTFDKNYNKKEVVRVPVLSKTTVC